jgi:RNA polymerase sigma-70 factor, ECF subfamily
MDGFDAAYRQHSRAVFRYALKCVGRHDVAEDLTAEAFLELHRHFAQIRLEELPGWLFVVVRNRSVDYWRRRAVEQRYLGGLPTREPGVAPELPFDPWWLRVQELKPVHRICLHLRYVHDLDRAEIARRLGLSEIQVKGYLQYARELLRRRLEVTSE